MGEFMKRRNFVKQLALSAAVAAIGFGSTGLWAQGKEVKIGVLHSLSGTMAISETVLKDTVLMAVGENNTQRGVLRTKVLAPGVRPRSHLAPPVPEVGPLLTPGQVAVTVS